MEDLVKKNKRGIKFLGSATENKMRYRYLIIGILTVRYCLPARRNEYVICRCMGIFFVQNDNSITFIRLEKITNVEMDLFK